MHLWMATSSGMSQAFLACPSLFPLSKRESANSKERDERWMLLNAHPLDMLVVASSAVVSQPLAGLPSIAPPSTVLGTTTNKCRHGQGGLGPFNLLSNME
jgi:hypothetical protein